MMRRDPSDRRRRGRRAARGGRGDRAVLPCWAAGDARRRRAAHLPCKPGRRYDGRRAHGHLSLRLDRPPAAGPQISRRAGPPLDRRRLSHPRRGDDESGTAGGGSETIVGPRSVFLANAHVAHDCRIGEGVILSNNVMLAGHCQIGDFAILSGGAAAHQFVRIGAHAFVGGLAGVEHDLIPVRPCAWQSRRARRPQCRWPEAPWLLARDDPRAQARLQDAVQWRPAP